MSAMSRNKGAAFERLVANMLTEATGTKWRRRVRNLEGESDVHADDPALAHIVIECKHANDLCLPKWWRQAQTQAARSLHGPVRIDGQLRVLDAIPVLIYRQTGAVGVSVQVDAHDVHPGTWPAPGRHVVTLGWGAAMQWMREQVPACAVHHQIEVAA